MLLTFDKVRAIYNQQRQQATTTDITPELERNIVQGIEQVLNIPESIQWQVDRVGHAFVLMYRIPFGVFSSTQEVELDDSIGRIGDAIKGYRSDKVHIFIDEVCVGDLESKGNMLRLHGNLKNCSWVVQINP